MLPGATSRTVISWLLLGGGAIAIVVSLIGVFTGDPQQGEGWAGPAIEAVFVGGPLLGVGLGLRSGRRTIARRVAICSGVLAALVAFVLVMQLLDPNETTADRLINLLGLIAYVAGTLVELPAFRHQSRSTEPTP
jgi:hypothetical protein